MTQPITSFRGRYSFLSNFHQDGVEYPFQAAKAIDPVERLWVWQAPTPAEAKRRGRLVTRRPDWEEVKDAVMLDLLRQKFRPLGLLATPLLETGDAELIEGNYWNDIYWGVCRGVGKNMLGVLLMQVRAELGKD